MHNSLIVYDVDGNEWVYDDCKAGLAPGQTLLVSQSVPDVTGRSEDGTTEKPVALFNPTFWTHVEYDVCSTE